MAELQSWFALVDGDDINDITAAADSENTKKQVKCNESRLTPLHFFFISLFRISAVD